MLLYSMNESNELLIRPLNNWINCVSHSPSLCNRLCSLSLIAILRARLYQSSHWLLPRLRIQRVKTERPSIPTSNSEHGYTARRRLSRPGSLFRLQSGGYRNGCRMLGVAVLPCTMPVAGPFPKFACSACRTLIFSVPGFTAAIFHLA